MYIGKCQFSLCPSEGETASCASRKQTLLHEQQISDATPTPRHKKYLPVLGQSKGKKKKDKIPNFIKITLMYSNMPSWQAKKVI